MKALAKLLFWLIVLTVVGAPVLAATLLWLALADQPLVTRTANLGPAQVEKARRILERNDPRRMTPASRRSVTIATEDANLAVSFLVSRFAQGRSELATRQGAARAKVTFQLPANPLGRFLNVECTLVETRALPRVEKLRIGRIAVPDFLAPRLAGAIADVAAERADVQLAAAILKNVSFSPGGLTLTYEWSADTLERVRAIALKPADIERLRAYQERLAQTTRSVSGGGSVSLVDVLAPLFRLAGDRAGGSDPADEHKALLLVLAAHVSGKDLSAIVPAARNWAQPGRFNLALLGRNDFAQHFAVSAAISALAGSALSDAIGLQKEIEDSRGGSGFSFNDIAADRAGTRFGELAVASASARRLQARAGAGLREPDIMPRVADLPEFMPEAEFKRRFGGVGAPAYERMMKDIEARVAALPINR